MPNVCLKDSVAPDGQPRTNDTVTDPIRQSVVFVSVPTTSTVPVSPGVNPMVVVGVPDGHRGCGLVVVVVGGGLVVVVVVAGGPLVPVLPDLPDPGRLLEGGAVVEVVVVLVVVVDTEVFVGGPTAADVRPPPSAVVGGEVVAENCFNRVGVGLLPPATQPCCHFVPVRPVHARTAPLTLHADATVGVEPLPELFSAAARAATAFPAT